MSTVPVHVPAHEHEAEHEGVSAAGPQQGPGLPHGRHSALLQDRNGQCGRQIRSPHAAAVRRTSVRRIRNRSSGAGSGFMATLSV